MPAKKSSKRKKAKPVQLPPAHDWRTTDKDEVLRRTQRAREEKHAIRNLDPEHPVFSTFSVASPSGMNYQTEIRDLPGRAFSCSCPDFRRNGLGTCKHIEATLIWLKRRQKGEFRAAEKTASSRIDLVPVGDTLAIERNLKQLSPALRALFDPAGLLLAEHDPAEILPRLLRSKKIRVSQDVEPFLESRRRAAERFALRRDYLTGVVEGLHPAHVTLHPLYPYQREGMLHLAFGERALLADEMGLGKTIQAIAACALLHHLGKAKRVLIVAPASLKSEWEDQIKKFTTLSQRVIFGPRSTRTNYYADRNPPFFTIVNYEQVVIDGLDINERLKPDIVVLDEAQRIKNWATKTAQAIKRLKSRYAFVLTGTPIENRIDELYSIVDFLDPSLFGPLFRFNRDFYKLDEKGRPEDYKNLAALRERVRPVILRRRKHHVETELPERTDVNHFVKLTPAMRAEYDEVKQQVSQLVQIAQRRPLKKEERELLMILLAMMRMICDSPSIIKNHDCQDCPKMKELAGILDDCLSDPDVKIIIFSEWEGMLRKVREWAEKNDIGFAWHTGTVPQQKRRGEIRAFHEDPKCRLFLSTDSGGVGLNLQNASVVVNCDLPWNPARLEQRIARAWRKHQKRPVTVVNLIAEDSIEHAMLGTLANKMNLSEGVLDGSDESLKSAKLKSGTEATLARLKQMLGTVTTAKPAPKSPPSDPALAFAQSASSCLGEMLVDCHETTVPDSDTPVIIAVVRSPDRASLLEQLHQETDWRGSTPDLRVIDEAAWATIQQLAECGLITLNSRTTRALSGPEAKEKPTLTPEQLQKITELRALATKKEKAAELLRAADLPEEAALQQEQAEQARKEAENIEGK